MACISLKVLKRHRLFVLDACGRIVITGLPVLDDTKSVNQLDLGNDVVTAGTTVQRTNVAGGYCLDQTSKATRKSSTMIYSGCGSNFDLAGIMGGWTTKTFAGGAAGTVYDDAAPTNGAHLLHELVFENPDGTCDASGNAQCVTALIQSEGWFPSGDQVVNGTDILHDQYTGRSVPVSTRLFENFVGDVPLGELVHWAPFFTLTGAGQYLGGSYKRTLIGAPCPTFVSAESCDLRAIVLT